MEYRCSDEILVKHSERLGTLGSKTLQASQMRQVFKTEFIGAEESIKHVVADSEMIASVARLFLY